MAKDDKVFPPVRLSNNGLEPYWHPQHIPGSPHRMPEGDGVYPQPSALIAGGGPSGKPTTPGEVGDKNAPPFRDPHHYASVISSFANVPNGSSVQVLQEQVGRRNLLMLRNNSATANIYVEFKKDASLSSVLRITPNTMVLFDVVVPQDEVFAYADAASAVLSFAYSSIQ